MSGDEDCGGLDDSFFDELANLAEAGVGVDGSSSQNTCESTFGNSVDVGSGCEMGSGSDQRSGVLEIVHELDGGHMDGCVDEVVDMQTSPLYPYPQRDVARDRTSLCVGGIPKATVQPKISDIFRATKSKSDDTRTSKAKFVCPLKPGTPYKKPNPTAVMKRSTAITNEVGYRSSLRLPNEKPFVSPMMSTIYLSGSPAHSDATSIKNPTTKPTIPTIMCAKIDSSADQRSASIQKINELEICTKFLDFCRVKMKDKKSLPTRKIAVSQIHRWMYDDREYEDGLQEMWTNIFKMRREKSEELTINVVHLQNSSNEWITMATEHWLWIDTIKKLQTEEGLFRNAMISCRGPFMTRARFGEAYIYSQLRGRIARCDREMRRSSMIRAVRHLFTNFVSSSFVTDERQLTMAGCRVALKCDTWFSDDCMSVHDEDDRRFLVPVINVATLDEVSFDCVIELLEATEDRGSKTVEDLLLFERCWREEIVRLADTLTSTEPCFRENRASWWRFEMRNVGITGQAGKLDMCKSGAIVDDVSGVVYHMTKLFERFDNSCGIVVESSSIRQQAPTVKRGDRKEI